MWSVFCLLLLTEYLPPVSGVASRVLYSYTVTIKAWPNCCWQSWRVVASSVSWLKILSPVNFAASSLIKSSGFFAVSLEFNAVIIYDYEVLIPCRGIDQVLVGRLPLQLKRSMWQNDPNEGYQKREELHDSVPFITYTKPWVKENGIELPERVKPSWMLHRGIFVY